MGKHTGRPAKSGIERVVEMLGSQAAVARVIGTTGEAVRQMVVRGHVSKPRHIRALRKACPEVTVAELVGVVEGQEMVGD